MAVAHRFFIGAALCLCLMTVRSALAQEKLSLNQPVNQTLTAGVTKKYPIRLNDGDYVEVSVASQSGTLNLVVANPDGSLMRNFAGPSAGGRNTYAFAAEGAGIFFLNIVNPGGQAAIYELTLQKIVSLDERFRPEEWTDPDPSPSIQELRKRISSGETSTESFWKRVAAQGTPLVEQLNVNYWLVTFLWRAQHDTRTVMVTGSFNVSGLTRNNQMHRIGDSDVWYLTLKLPKGARFTYRLVPNDPPVSESTQATVQADSYNPRRWDCPKTAEKFLCRSIVELPDAAPQPWIVSKPGTPAGRIEKQTIKSAIQKLERDLFIYTPAGYKADGPPNALLVLFDGDDILSDDFQGQTTLDNLIAARKIPPTVVVMVDNVRGRRLVDLVANPEFADFMAMELVPWLWAHYNVTRDPARTVVCGKSAGGLAAAYMGLRHPEVFGNVFSQSGAFWWSPEHSGGVCASKCPEDGGRRSDPDSEDSRTEGNWIAKQFVTSPKLPVRFFLEAGTFEVDRERTGADILEATRTLRDVLLAKGHEVHFQQFVSGHDDLSWRGTFAEGLITLLGQPQNPRR
jgi:enterochelin esterase-like enzyme